MSLRIAGVLACVSIFVTGLWSSSRAQDQDEGFGIKGPFTILVEAPVPMNTDLRSLPIAPPLRRGGSPIEVPLHIPLLPEVTPAAPLRQESPSVPFNSIDPLKIEAPSFSIADPNFDGIRLFDPGVFFVPPDTNGDVGPNHYVQVVNSSIAVFDKHGNTMAGPLPINALFATLGGSCAGGTPIDPIVNYDPLADRWLVVGFPFASPVCIAVSQTADPVAGGWFLYELNVTSFPDYPKIGVWPDAYYLSTQMGSADVYALDRSSMLNGAALQAIHFSLDGPFLLPADLDGRPPRDSRRAADKGGPKASAPAPFARHLDGDFWGGEDRLEIFEFHANFDDPQSSTFKLAASLPTEPFSTVLCGDPGFGVCAEQPNGARLETLPVWLMWRLQYSNFGSHETLVANHTIAVDSLLGEGAGIRWYELRRRNGPWSIFQSGTHAPQDPAATSFLHRWMGSIAMDKRGNIALGFSGTSGNEFPSVRYVGRLVKDPPGTMPQGGPDGDVVMVAGENSTFDERWGDYSSMSVDPADGCTFWYTQEYVGAELGIWRTRVGAFRFPSCH